MKQLSIFIASGFYSGYSPIAPGTFGSLVGVILLFGLYKFGLADAHLVILAITIAITFIGYVSVLGLPSDWVHDDQKIVIDEVVGIFVTILFIPISVKTLILSFILFRIFDIWKPLGIKRMDNLSSQFSVIVDDVLAGVYANVVLRVLMLLLPAI